MLDSNTTVRELRYHALQQLIATVLANDVPGDFAECGCWKGLSAYITCRMISESIPSDRGSFIFSIPSRAASRTRRQKTAEQGRSLTDREQDEKAYFASTMARARSSALSGFRLLHPQQGLDTAAIPGVRGRIDSPSLTSMSIFTSPRGTASTSFSPGCLRVGIIYCDDYNASFFPGAKRALDEGVEKHREEVAMVFEIPLNAVFVVKR